jgi:hypothetical protein
MPATFDICLRRQAREVMGKLFIALMAVTIALLIGFSVWVIAL